MMSFDWFTPALQESYRRILPGCIVLSALPDASATSIKSVAPTPREDQSFSSPRNTAALIRGGSHFVAQTFTAGMTGILTAVSVDVESSSNFPLHVAVHAVTAGIPNGHMLGERYLWSATCEPISSAALSLQVDLGMDVYVRAGRQYAIVVDYGDCGFADRVAGNWAGVAGECHNGCPGQEAFTTCNPTLRTWRHISPGFQLRFRTFVLPAMPAPDLSIARVSGPRCGGQRGLFIENYCVRNMGGKPVENAFLSVGGAGQFESVNVDGAPGPMSAPFSLAPGESRPITVCLQVGAPLSTGPATVADVVPPQRSRDPGIAAHGPGSVPQLISGRRTTLFP